MKLKYLIISIVFITSCNHNRKIHNTPKSLIAKYNLAVKSNKPKDAWNLMDKDLQKKMTWPIFLQNWEKNRRELLAQVNDMNKKPDVKLVIKRKKSTSIVMISEKGKWKVDSAPGIVPQTASPLLLINLMIKAIQNYDLQLYMSLLSDEYRQSVVAELKNKLKILEKAKTYIEKNNSSLVDVLIVPLDASGNTKLVLKKVHNRWEIDSWIFKKHRKWRR